MSLASDSNKALRGVKRVCQSCEVRFYDLTRDPNVCPACGAQGAPAVWPVIDATARMAPFSQKTGWRSKGFKRPEPVPMAEPESAEAPAAEDAAEDTATPVAEDDIVLEHEPDDGDVSGLIVHEVEDPKDR